MRIHIQNPTHPQSRPVTPELWQQAVERAGAIGQGHQISFGLTREEGAAGLAEAEMLLSAASAVRALFPTPAPHLKTIFCTSAGLDQVAPFDWIPSGVTLVNNSGAHNAKAGEYGVMAVLMLANHIPAFATMQRKQHWEQRLSPVVRGRRLTIIGIGDLGGACAMQARRFGLHVTGVRTRAAPHPHCDRVIGADELDTELPETDVLLLACPLTPATRHLMDRRRLSLLPKGAGVINIGRGGLIEQDALCDLLESGHLGGAVLDVFTPEPVPPGHRLWTTPNLLMTPHMSCDDPETYNAVSLDIFFANLRAIQEGRTPPNLFDTARGY